MANLKICRICVRTEVKMYNFDRQYLKTAYEDVMGYKVDKKDGLPISFCYECAALLHKFHKFKEKCYFGQMTLQKISWKGPITYKSIKNLNRNHEYLKPLLEVMATSERIQTLIIRSKEVKQKLPEPQLKKEIEFIADSVEDPILDTAVDSPVKTNVISDDEIDNLDEPALDPESDLIIKSLINNESETEIFLDTLKEPVFQEESFDNDEKEINDKYLDLIGKDEEIVEVKKENNIIKRKKPRFQRINNLPIDLTYWKKTILSEEEALKTFNAKAEESYYISAAYKCTLCYKGFSKEDMLKRHNILRHNEKMGQFVCRLCKMRFRLPCQLKKHMKCHFHKFECLRCNLVCCLETTAQLHNEYHSGLKRKCEHCGEEFRHTSTYYTHMRTHRSAHVCTLCGSSFVSDIGLRNHKKIKHIAHVENYDDEELNTFCKRCDIRFETRKAYEEHLFHSVMHSEINETDVFDDDLVPKKIRGRRLKREISDELRSGNEDDMPLSSFKRPKKARRVCKKPTTCHQCGKHFATQAECMKHHIVAHPRTSFHSPSERHICEVCGVSLAPGSVAMHENIHTRKKLHPCETCGKVFHTGIGLKRHVVTHTGEKPYACSLCDKRFTQSNSMKLHFKTFHLKQPYPKRNRRKKKDEITELPETNREESASQSSGHSPEQIRRDSNLMLNRLHEDNMQYLTLS